MADEMEIDGKNFASSKRAASITGYAQDYIGQLARTGQINARRVGGMWFVEIASLESYKSGETGQNAALSTESNHEEPIQESLVGLDGKSYISANRASKISGYNQDYIGQLARSGQIVARQVGNRWYVESDSLMNHKKEKDELLAAVQAESVGLSDKISDTEIHNNNDGEPSFKYFSENDRDLGPKIADTEDPNMVERPHAAASQKREPAEDIGTEDHADEAHKVPIRVRRPTPVARLEPYRASEPQISRSYYGLYMSLAAVLVVTGIGFWAYSTGMIVANSPAIDTIAGALERVLTKELHYVRNN